MTVVVGPWNLECDAFGFGCVTFWSLEFHGILHLLRPRQQQRCYVFFWELKGLLHVLFHFEFCCQPPPPAPLALPHL